MPQLAYGLEPATAAYFLQLFNEMHVPLCKCPSSNAVRTWFSSSLLFSFQFLFFDELQHAVSRPVTVLALVPYFFF
jgi:hypothetical protein